MQAGTNKLRAPMKSLRAVTGFGAMAAMLVLAGCRQDMHNQPKMVPQRGSSVFADGRSVRPQIMNTVARSQGHEDAYFFTGLVAGKEGDGMPLPVTIELLERGQERYNIYCTACHSRVGNGVGMIVQRGYRPAGNFHTERLRNAPLGHFFAVMTNGFGAMPDYSAQLTPADRWAVAAYIRALQLSQNAKQSDVASGQHVQELHEIAKEQGMPEGFADPWALPNTAVYGTPNGQDNGIPGQPGAGVPGGAKANLSGPQGNNAGNSNVPPATTLSAPGTNAQQHMSVPQSQPQAK